VPVPPPIPFDELREFFADEDEYGQLCDIHAPDADLDAWAAFLRLIAVEYSYRFSLTAGEGDASEQPLPDDPAPMLLLAGSDEGPWPSLSLDLEGLPARVLFYGPDEVEVDFWRTKVTPQSYQAIATLMHRMGDAMGVDIFLTPESRPCEAAIVYEAKERRFRRPKCAEGDQGGLRERLLGEIAAVVHPLLRDPSLPDKLLLVAMERIESLQAQFGELSLQDGLTAEERADLDRLWSNIATIVRPPPGVRTERRWYEPEVLELAQRFR
jgi:hypothetical protein